MAFLLVVDISRQQPVQHRQMVPKNLSLICVIQLSHKGKVHFCGGNKTCTPILDLQFLREN
ncbi:hypothetical protein DPMN_148775 [Dreissena polymorpha]|uniref:Uncharacterized protein n=1 Tax=Dreissena polymorpha TaxID=45954 RepID=A0A9D4FG74_DREPO|nr:hypothetical protein DPMN_148775 [Dreissena polymorpha]